MLNFICIDRIYVTYLSYSQYIRAARTLNACYTSVTTHIHIFCIGELLCIHNQLRTYRSHTATTSMKPEHIESENNYSLLYIRHCRCDGKVRCVCAKQCYGLVHLFLGPPHHSLTFGLDILHKLIHNSLLMDIFSNTFVFNDG